MKKILSILLVLTVIFSFAACSGGSSSGAGENWVVGDETGEKIQTILTPSEYVLYQNVFFNEQGDDYVDQQVMKKGILACIQDEFSQVKRYYVWGYNDNTKCCDWQWEFVPENEKDLPSVGSTVNVIGTFKKHDNALDGYWIENATVETLVSYKGSTADVDMTTMGGTLERVQLINLQNFADNFEGKTVAAYGRIESADSIQHPYYNGAFSQKFESDDGVKATGTVVIVEGTYSDGIIKNAKLTETRDY